MVLSGGFGKLSNSARAGFLPVCLDHMPPALFDGINVFLRTGSEAGESESFTLFCSASLRFTEQHRKRLAETGVKFIYIPIAEHSKFRQQTESKLVDLASDPTIAISVKAEIVYETSVELVNELLSNPDLTANASRLENVSRAVAMLTLNDPTSFSHLFAASHHDFYTATHMVNVATWMVPLAYAMGHHDTDELSHICQAGLLHDIGKTYVASEILNARGRLSAAQWEQIQRHPQFGAQHLAKYDGIHPLVHKVTIEHHERMDGTGYPNRLKGDQIDPVSRICAVVDSFDAMTAFRPFKERTMSVADAMRTIISETPQKYDAKVVEAWTGLVDAASLMEGEETPTDNKGNRRAFSRFRINCPARLHVLETDAAGWKERLGLPMIAHNISRCGIGLLSQRPVNNGERVRIYLTGQGTLQGLREGHTVRCRDYRDGWFELGMKYEELASAEPAPAATAATAA
ncbi:MAG TPA: HD domain-containing phosphohydrolase [Tepidisphaeraceae bacterium]|nr:HD domain-containing phosphohydrolase [Tepidisphaeraceae bacterium]